MFTAQFVGDLAYGEGCGGYAFFRDYDQFVLDMLLCISPGFYSKQGAEVIPGEM